MFDVLFLTHVSSNMTAEQGFPFLPLPKEPKKEEKKKSPSCLNVLFAIAQKDRKLRQRIYGFTETKEKGQERNRTLGYKSETGKNCLIRALPLRESRQDGALLRNIM